MKALITGFDAFGGDKINPSSLAVRQLKRRIGSVVMHTAVLPTSYARSPIVLRAAIHEVQPDIVLGVGQAGGRAELCLERRDFQKARQLLMRGVQKARLQRDLLLERKAEALLAHIERA